MLVADLSYGVGACGGCSPGGRRIGVRTCLPGRWRPCRCADMWTLSFCSTIRPAVGRRPLPTKLIDEERPAPSGAGLLFDLSRLIAYIAPSPSGLLFSVRSRLVPLKWGVRGIPTESPFDRFDKLTAGRLQGKWNRGIEETKLWLKSLQLHGLIDPRSLNRGLLTVASAAGASAPLCATLACAAPASARPRTRALSPASASHPGREN